jgi:hypothetical protein
MFVNTILKMKKRNSLNLLGLAISLVIAGNVAANTLLVPDNYPKIQDAINAANHGDTVLVKAGTYVENIKFNGKNITVKSIEGAKKTIIDGNKQDSVVQFINQETAQAVLDGFTITKGIGTKVVPQPSGVSGRTFGGGIWVYNNSSPTLRNLIITDNYGMHGGGIGMWNNANPTVENVLLTNNLSSWCTLGVWFSPNPKFTNVTVADNRGCGVWIHDSNPMLTNSILWNNFGGWNDEIILWSSPKITVSNSLVRGGKPTGSGVNWLTGNLSTDPLFVDAANQNYRLAKNSPAIDAGTTDNAPTTDLDNNPRIKPDIGAYEYLSELQANCKATYDTKTRIVSIPAIDIATLDPLTGKPIPNQIATFSAQLQQQLGVDDFRLLENSLQFLGMVAQADLSHARYIYNDDLFSNGGILEMCARVENVVSLPLGMLIPTPPQFYKVKLRQLAVQPDIFHVEEIQLVM